MKTSGQLESALAMLSVVLHSSRRNLKDMKRFGYYEMLLGLLREKKLLLEVPVMQRVTDLVFW